MTHNDVVTPAGNLEPQGVPVYSHTKHVHDTISSTQTLAQQKIMEK